MDYQRWGSGIREATPIAKCDKTGKKERPFTQSLTTTFGCWNLYPKRVFIIQFVIWSPCFVTENPSPKISRRVSSFGCLSFAMIGLTTFRSGCQWSSTYQPVHHIHISHLQIGCIIAKKKLVVYNNVPHNNCDNLWSPAICLKIGHVWMIIMFLIKMSLPISSAISNLQCKLPFLTGYD